MDQYKNFILIQKNTVNVINKHKQNIRLWDEIKPEDIQTITISTKKGFIDTFIMTKETAIQLCDKYNQLDYVFIRRVLNFDYVTSFNRHED